MKEKKICWPIFLYIAGYHLFLAVALPIYFMYKTPDMSMIWAMLAMVFVSGIAVTTGYHRLYSHKAYTAHPAIEPVLLFFASLATEGSALRWCFDHRLHHAFVDKDRDPYTVKKGFWHAHILWMFHRTETIDPKVIADLWRKKLLRFQHENYIACMLVSNGLLFLAAGWYFSDYWGAFIFMWMLRMFLLHHTTWCINSLAHYWGSQSYSEEHSAVDNYLISIVTYGEGYHNYHHTFVNDYRNGIRWYHFDPTKWLIWTLHKLGLASDLKTVSDFRIKKELLKHHRDDLLQKLTKSYHEQKEVIAAKVVEVHDNLNVKLSQLQALLDKTAEVPRQELIAQIRVAKAEFKSEWKRWKATLKTISKQKMITI